MRSLGVLILVVLALGVGGVRTTSGHGSTSQSYTGGYGPVWSPDGTQIAYIGPEPNLLAHPPTDGWNHVLVVSVTGGGAPKVVATAPRCREPAGATSCQPPVDEVRWARDGRMFYETESTLWSTAGHSAERLGVIGSGGEDPFVVSDDGREVAFTAPCRCSVEQGTEVQFI